MLPSVWINECHTDAAEGHFILTFCPSCFQKHWNPLICSSFTPTLNPFSKHHLYVCIILLGFCYNTFISPETLLMFSTTPVKYLVWWLCSDYLLVCVEERTDGAVWRFRAHALVVLPLFLQDRRPALPQVSQRLGPVLTLQTTFLHRGRLLWGLWETKSKDDAFREGGSPRQARSPQGAQRFTWIKWLNPVWLS